MKLKLPKDGFTQNTSYLLIRLQFAKNTVRKKLKSTLNSTNHLAVGEAICPLSLATFGALVMKKIRSKKVIRTLNNKFKKLYLKHKLQRKMENLLTKKIVIKVKYNKLIHTLSFKYRQFNCQLLISKMEHTMPSVS